MQIRKFKERKIINQLAVGEEHCLILFSDKTIKGVGSNQFGQLGLMQKQRNLIIHDLIDIKLFGCDEDYQVKQISAGQFHNLYLLEDSQGNQKIYVNGKVIRQSLDNVDPDELSGLREQKLSKIKDENKEMKISKIYSRFNTNVFYTEKDLYIWGDTLTGQYHEYPTAFMKFDGQVNQIAIGQKHGLILVQDIETNRNIVYGWGDGTYGELGPTQNGQTWFKPEIIEEFEELKPSQIAAGARHSLILDRKGLMYVIGDNSFDQCLSQDRRAYEAKVIQCQEEVEEIYSGRDHNIAVSKTGIAYSWGGSLINKGWGNNNQIELDQIEDLQNRYPDIIDLSYSNTIIITGQSNI
ncbi:UNKNOWN [Stylonychia lemnae]|uniref:Uncharacterized protein n=1 Tax=Stylonychia lemnae TaxID=5949 RepID=A0A077ZQB2_STYLE|nr:UNKNOWN [Stylonychia lemnae]|eukprot:CDW72098.1 UNKNOWN [Stylonychia lemnae]